MRWKLSWMRLSAGLLMDANQDCTVEVSDRAKRMLLSHIRFLAEANPDVAETAKERILAGIRSLKNMPMRRPFFQAEFIPPNKYHRMFIENWYLVLYQIKGLTVYVDYIVDCRQDYRWLVK